MSKDLHDKLAWAGIVLGIVLILLQGSITIPQRMAEGGGPWRALVFYFSYFTILTNTGVVLVYLASVTGRRRLRALAGPTARTMMAGSILVVMVVYAVVLAPLWNPQGLALWTDMGLHYLTPVLFLIWWLAGPHPVPLRWGRASVMLVYPLAYLVWVILRGIVIGRWPYPFVNVPELGWGPVVANIAIMTVVFLIVFLGFIALTRVLNSRARYGRLRR